jgi:magnesium transporter
LWFERVLVLASGCAVILAVDPLRPESESSMARLTSKRSRKTGLPPGSLVHIGEQKTETVAITVRHYDEQQFQEKSAATFEECIPYKDGPGTTWINVDGIHQVETLEKLGSCFGLHPLVLEDILNTEQRPKMEDYDSYIYIVLNILQYDESKGEVVNDQISLILAKNTLISLQEKETDIFIPIIQRIKNGKGRVRTRGADYLAYTLLDAIIDHYFVLIEKIGEKITSLEEELLQNPAPQTVKRIHHLRREMIFLRKSVWPLREVISGLERGESALIQDTTLFYLRDVYDHTIQVMDTIETFRDMLSGMLDIYLSSVSNRLNAVMKVLTIIATIFMPLTFIAGIYGMNFKYMPELEWPWGYPLILLTMLAIAVFMLAFFRRKKWL